MGKTRISARALLGSRLGSSTLKIYSKMSEVETPNRCASRVKISGLDSRGMKCFRYVSACLI